MGNQFVVNRKRQYNGKKTSDKKTNYGSQNIIQKTEPHEPH